MNEFTEAKEFFDSGQEIYFPECENASFDLIENKHKKKAARRVKKMTFLLAAGLSFLPVGLSSCGETGNDNIEYYSETGNDNIEYYSETVVSAGMDGVMEEIYG